MHPFSRQRADLRQVHPRVVPDDVHTWFVLVHRLQNDLQMEVSASDPLQASQNHLMPQQFDISRVQAKQRRALCVLKVHPEFRKLHSN